MHPYDTFCKTLKPIKEQEWAEKYVNHTSTGGPA